MDTVEITGKTEEEAIHKALTQLGKREDEVNITVLKKARSGILGLGAEEAVVRVEAIGNVLQDPGAIDNSPLQDSEPLPENIIKAKEILKTLLEHLKIQSSLSAVPYPSMSEEDARPSIALDISLKGEDQALLIGRRGQTLVSLQYITNLILSVNNKNLSPVTVDVEGYKQRRFKSLQSLALRLAEQVRTSRRPATMEPMPPNERRIVHLTLSKWDDIDTESSGEGENRKVVIKYRGM